MATGDERGDVRDSEWERDRPSGLDVKMAILMTRLATMEKKLEDLVTRQEFMPVKLLAYSLAGSLLAGVVAALLAQVIRR